MRGERVWVSEPANAGEAQRDNNSNGSSKCYGFLSAHTLLSLCCFIGQLMMQQLRSVMQHWHQMKWQYHFLCTALIQCV